MPNDTISPFSDQKRFLKSLSNVILIDNVIDNFSTINDIFNLEKKKKKLQRIM